MIRDIHLKKSEDKIYQALVQMQAENISYKEITIRQIAGYANISRQTFYRHYSQKDDVIKRRIHQVKLLFLDEMTNHKVDLEFMRQTLQFWKIHHEFFKMIEWANLRLDLVDNIAFLNRSLMTSNNVAHLDMDYMINTYAGATYMFLRTYLIDHNAQGDISQIAELFLKMTNQHFYIYQ
ncbi:hypothetical protein ADT67_12535 [Levilactobacillus brevis]|uniref:Uncharacterized protein n=1 Tax=Levilactobacillus brevis TaxID=1580 RepID=A0A5B7XY42_LEVBR|nr:TetR/AcrR family transcriptional regulator [Levilactobacillus brevis]AJA80732.1 hypothetical protein L747_02740 [Levilactobacillus brevis BSO 464]KIO93769.1 hypothetical protein N627_2296 [Levilactobacillus brevis]KIO95182.1 hypothetical protein N624_1296 [Levilactobacillus brevis]OLF66238.1 hypothetical protein ADT67_12535 [Levilactobacillus brevis]QCZ52764.1 hypothetical protein UCCLBBS449_0795 [Levilactobacillus brevis]